MNEKKFKKKLLLLFLVFALLFTFISNNAWSLNEERAMQRIRRGSITVLQNVSPAEMTKLHNHQGVYYYIARKIGKPATRSLFACLKNRHSEVRRICADNLYQLSITYVHKKLLLYYFQKETDYATRLSLQDLLVRINTERFFTAQNLGDGNFLAKVNYNDVAYLFGKYSSYESKDFKSSFRFLKGGMRNPDDNVKIFSIRLMKNLDNFEDQVRGYLEHSKKGGQYSARVKQTIESILQR